MRFENVDRILVIGGGLAGLATALRIAPLPVDLIVASPLANQSTSMSSTVDCTSGGSIKAGSTGSVSIEKLSPWQVLLRSMRATKTS